MKQKWCHLLWPVCVFWGIALLGVLLFEPSHRDSPIEPPPAPVEQLTLDTVLRIREDVALTRTELAAIRRMLERMEAKDE